MSGNGISGNGGISATGTPSASAYLAGGTPPTWTNFDASVSLAGQPAALRAWRAAVAKVRNGTADARLVMIGDSTTAGAKATSAVTSMPARMVPAIVRAGLPCAYAGVFGERANGFDPRIVKGTGWTFAGYGNIGNGGFKRASGTTGVLSFTPADSFDTITIWSARDTGQGLVSVDVDGGAALGTINANGATGLTKTVLACAAGTHTINITGVSGGDFYLRGMEVSSSTQKRVQILNFGQDGAGSTSFNTFNFPFADLFLIDSVAASLAVINLTIINSNAGTNLATYTAGLTTLANRFVAAGASIIMMIGAGSNPQPANYASYVDAVYSLGYPVVDLSLRWGTYAQASPLGLMDADGIHPSDLGYWESGTAVYNALRLV